MRKQSRIQNKIVAVFLVVFILAFFLILKMYAFNPYVSDENVYLYQANLVANWSIRGKGGADLVTMQKTVVSTEVEAEASYAEAARALSKTVEILSHIIADTISKDRQN